MSPLRIAQSIILLALLFCPITALAVPPPDFAFNILPQLWQTLSLSLVFVLGSLISIWQSFKIQFLWFWHHKIISSIILMTIIGGGFIGTRFYIDYLQNKAYQNWIAESQKQSENINSSESIKNDNQPLASQEPKSNDPNPESKNTLLSTEETTSKENIPQNSLKTLPNTDPDKFFNENQNAALFISNADFKSILNNKSVKPFILDAREEEEYEIGHFPEVNHIRMADLFDSRWQELPKDKPVYVFCWSGIRGKEVAEFLRSKKVLGVYFEDGASGWFKDKGDWIGDISFKSKYTEERYSKVFKKEEVMQFQKEGVVLVDSRLSEKYKKKHIKGSINLPTLYTPTSDLDKIISQIPKGSKVLTICDEYVNCYDARITGIKLEKAGMIFLGRYNQPWELS